MRSDLERLFKEIEYWDSPEGERQLALMPARIRNKYKLAVLAETTKVDCYTEEGGWNPPEGEILYREFLELHRLADLDPIPMEEAMRVGERIKQTLDTLSLRANRKTVH